MSVEPAIQVNNLVKEFRVYHRSYGTLKSTATNFVSRVIARDNQPHYSLRRALDGVSFSIPPGETVGLIGRNGSGKSTLLAILSRIYLPTSGSARLHGEFLSLLELGVGFDDELTGAENVFFAAMLRGLTPNQVADRYPSIVEFSELGDDAMDLPTRMYSSGMRMRLAFAIVAHLDADILLLDEGLAVGDIAFQQKCFSKMAEFQAEGRTIIMVAHEMAAVRQYASRTIWLDRGVLKMDGPVDEVTAAYEADMAAE